MEISLSCSKIFEFFAENGPEFFENFSKKSLSMQFNSELFENVVKPRPWSVSLYILTKMSITQLKLIHIAINLFFIYFVEYSFTFISSLSTSCPAPLFHAHHYVISNGRYIKLILQESELLVGERYGVFALNHTRIEIKCAVTY